MPVVLYYTALARFQDSLCSAYNNQTRVLGLIIQKQTTQIPTSEQTVVLTFSVLSQFVNLQQWKNCKLNSYRVSIFRLLTLVYDSRCLLFNCIMVKLKLLQIKSSYGQLRNSYYGGENNLLIINQIIDQKLNPLWPTAHKSED